MDRVLTVVFLSLFLFAPACGQTIPNVGLNLTLPNVQNRDLTNSACQPFIEKANTICFGDNATTAANVSQIISLAVTIVPALRSPLSILSVITSALATVNRSIVMDLFEPLCTNQSCTTAITEAIQNCLPFQSNSFRKIFVLLINFVTEFLCGRGGSRNELCVIRVLSANELDNILCALQGTVSGICMEDCKMHVQNVANDFGCCNNNYVKAFEDTIGIDVSALRTVADGIWDVCNVTKPGVCTTDVSNPLTASPTSSSRAVSTAGVLTFVLMLYAMYWQM